MDRTLGQLLLAVIRVLLGGLFVFAGAQKIAAPGLLYSEIVAYRLNYVVSSDAGDGSAGDSIEAPETGPAGSKLESRRPGLSSSVYETVAKALAFFLPWLEVVAGSLLIAGSRARPAALIVAGMLAVYLLGYWWAITMELDLKCSCFGETDPFCGDATIGVCHLIRNGVMLGAAVLIMGLGGGVFALDGRATAAETDED